MNAYTLADLRTRKEAVLLGATRYRTGKSCPHGHVADRMVSTRACCVCLREWEKATPERRAKRNLRHTRCSKKTPEKRTKVNRYRRKWRRATEGRRFVDNARNRRTGVLQRWLRVRLNKALNGNQKTGSAVADLGCSIPEFKERIEARFQNGMTWENRGKTWHLDHVKPFMFFDLTDREQFLQVCHYTNYQPLFVEDHRAKTAVEMGIFNRARSIGRPVVLALADGRLG